MPLNKPVLDDRSYAQIRDDLVRRIPVYAPEWTDHNVSDPGIALLELFSYLTENILFRFNQIPEATQLEFLRLLQIPLRPASSAQSLVAFTTDSVAGERIPLGSATCKAGSIGFTPLDEVRVLPLTAIGAIKAGDELPTPGTEEEIFYQQAYESAGVAEDNTVPYSTHSIWVDSPGTPRDLANSVDGILWVAVLAEEGADATQADTLRTQLQQHEDAPLLLNIGFVPEIDLEPIEAHDSQAFADRFRCSGEDAESDPHAINWQISTGNISPNGQPNYTPLQFQDTTNGLHRPGVIRVQLPDDVGSTGPFTLDDPNLAGTGDFPPQLDAETEARLLFWLRAFRRDDTSIGRVLYVGANAVSVEQRLSAQPEALGTGDGQPNRTFSLSKKQIIPGTLILEVEEAAGWIPWLEVENFFDSGKSDRHFSVDHEAGLVQFGNGLKGLTPQIGQRIRVREYQFGGGVEGNVGPKAISKLSPNKAVKLANLLAAYGGADAETVAAALERIPGELRRRDRAVTRGDFRELALATPGATIGRAEVLPRYHPQLPDEESAGVVSVIVWPQSDSKRPNAPLPNNNQIHAVCEYLVVRRLVTTELYVMPPRYRQLAIAVGVKVKAGFGTDAVRHWVELVLRQYLAPLPPYGPNGTGWPLGRRVLAAELVAAAHQVQGVEYLEGLELVGWDENGDLVSNNIELDQDQVPELIGITVESGPITVNPGELLAPIPPTDTPVPIPVLREEC